jgi:hypothetical protein
VAGLSFYRTEMLPLKGAWMRADVYENLSRLDKTPFLPLPKNKNAIFRLTLVTDGVQDVCTHWSS